MNVGTIMKRLCLVILFAYAAITDWCHGINAETISGQSVDKAHKKKESNEPWKIEEMLKYLTIAGWYLDLDEKLFDLGKFKQDMTFPSNMIDPIKTIVDEIRRTIKMYPKPRQLLNFRWTRNFDKINQDKKKMLLQMLSNDISQPSATNRINKMETQWTILARDGLSTYIIKKYPCTVVKEYRNGQTLKIFESRFAEVSNVQIKNDIIFIAYYEDQLKVLDEEKEKLRTISDDDALMDFYNSETYTEGIKVILERQPYKNALIALEQLMIHKNSAGLEMFDEACQRFNDLNYIKILTDNTYASALDYDRKKLIQVIKIVLGDLIGALFLQKACNKQDFVTQWWTSAIELMQRTETVLLEDWHSNGLSKEAFIREYKYNEALSNEQIVTEIKSYLEDKYYWNTFAVHLVFSDEAKSKSVGLLKYACDTPSRKSLRGDIYFSYSKPLLVRWTKFTHTDDYNPPETVKKAITVLKASGGKQDATDTFTKLAAWSGLVGSASDAIKDGVDTMKTYKSLVKEASGIVIEASQRVKDFKPFIRLLGTVAMFAGPVAASICSILSANYDTGFVDVINEIRDGFSEMHRRFDGIEERLDDLGKLVTVEIARQTYNEKIRNMISIFGNTKDNFERLPDHPKTSRAMRQFCNDDTNAPHVLLKLIELNTASTIGFGHSLFKEANYDFVKVRQGLILIAGDALTLSSFHMSTCLPLVKNSQAYETLISAKSALSMSHIIDQVSKLDNQLTEDWPSRIRFDVDDVVKRVSWKGRHELAKEIHQLLTNKYPWNEFYIALFQDKMKDETYRQQHWLTHPDYTKYVRVKGSEEWDVVVNWHSKSAGQAANVAHARSKLKDIISTRSHCINGINGALDDFNVKDIHEFGIKSIYVRRDNNIISEEGTYWKDPTRSGDHEAFYPELGDTSNFYMQNSLNGNKCKALVNNNVNYNTTVTYIFNFGGELSMH